MKVRTTILAGLCGVVIAVGIAFVASLRPREEAALGRLGDVAVATIGESDIIRMAELEAYWREHDPRSYARLNQQFYETQLRVLNEMLGERLLEYQARAKGRTADQVLGESLPGRMDAVTDEEVREMYYRSSARQHDTTLEEAAPSIRTHLRSEKEKQARSRYLEELRHASSAKVRVLLDVPRQELAQARFNPVKGDESAPITLVEFADFECAYCRQISPILKELLEKFDGKVKLVWKDYPLSNHRYARQAAEAGQCAQEQSKFWQFHDSIFTQEELRDVGDIVRHAEIAGVEMNSFRRCFESGRHRASVISGLREGSTAGLSVTPTVFVNGRRITGAMTADVYEQAIREELARIDAGS